MLATNAPLTTNEMIVLRAYVTRKLSALIALHTSQPTAYRAATESLTERGMLRIRTVRTSGLSTHCATDKGRASIWY